MTDAMADPVLGLAVPFIAEHEGFRSHPYQDEAGVFTIGYGFTVNEDGSHVMGATMPVTQEAAYARLTRMVASVAARVGQIVHREMTPHQAAALTSFAYNVGTHALLTSTLLKLFEAGEIAAAADQFRAWVYAGGHRSDGLMARREAERAMFLGLGAGTAPPPHEITADELNAAELRRVEGA